MKEFAEFFNTASKQQQRVILESLVYKQLKFLIEIIYNAVMDNIPISKSDKNKLIRHKLTIRKVLAEGIGPKQRQKRLLSLKGSLLTLFVKAYLEWQKN